MSLSPLAEMLSRKRLLIFDFDGTLVDSSPLHARAFNHAFAGEGIQVDYATIAGLTTPAAVDKVAAGAGLTLSEASRASLISAKQAFARALIESELSAVEGSVKFVRRAERRYALALCTSASRTSAELALDRVGLAGAFEPVVTAGDVDHGKPHPEGFLKALAHHKMEAAEAIVFEDAASGLEAAAAAGIDAIHVAPPGAPELGSPRADWAMLNAALDEIGL
ncbi:MAG: HAD family hydrolase [Gammaproteobacteria bacterium]